MTKLIDLFNEYNRSPEIAEGEPVDERTETEFLLMSKEKRAYMLSKDYGFIKWLVDNDKIDKKKIDTRLVKDVESHYDEEGYWVENSYEDYELYECLLMLLAISDTPIEDLISYLK